MNKKIVAVIGIIVILAGALFAACSKTKDEKILVAYFSATGNTKAVALQLAEKTGADLFEIVPKEPYTKIQLGYDDPDRRITKEQEDESCRVEIAGAVENFEQYDTVYIGYPIWYGKAPRIILTFLESYNFDGKEIIPFCTSDNDEIEAGLEEIKSIAPNAEWLEGQRFDGGKVTESLDVNGKIADDAVKQEIADFAEKTSPNSETNKKKRRNGTTESTTKAFAGEEVSFEEGSSTVETEPSESSATTTTTTPSSTTQKRDNTTTTQKSDSSTTTTEQVTESTTLGEHDTPYIPIP